MALGVYFYIAEAISRKKFETFEEWLRNTLTRLIFARLIFARINFCGFSEFSPIRENLSPRNSQNCSNRENKST